MLVYIFRERIYTRRMKDNHLQLNFVYQTATAIQLDT